MSPNGDPTSMMRAGAALAAALFAPPPDRRRGPAARTGRPRSGT
ncbi:MULTISPECIES: hypothetical protein [unclassified Arthrobacter]|nr:MULTISPECIES: hypothetical protein [unclassified Arthrobacter]WGZ79068.1 hypothetical protein QI450_14585 [Arthrobacter sp. EM1]